MESRTLGLATDSLDGALLGVCKCTRRWDMLMRAVLRNTILNVPMCDTLVCRESTASCLAGRPADGRFRGRRHHRVPWTSGGGSLRQPWQPLLHQNPGVVQHARAQQAAFFMQCMVTYTIVACCLAMPLTDAQNQIGMSFLMDTSQMPGSLHAARTVSVWAVVHLMS